MLLSRLFFFSLFFFWVLWGFSTPSSERIQKINHEIEQLEQMKLGFEARALRHENQAEYLQFDQQAVLETRRHLQLAEENREKAARVQEQIDRLKAERQKLSR